MVKIVFVVAVARNGVIGAAGAVALGVMSSGSTSSSGVQGPLGGVVVGVGILIYAVVLWAVWKLLALVAQYIALRTE